MKARGLVLQALDLLALGDPMLLWTSTTPAARIGQRPAVKVLTAARRNFESIGTGIERDSALPELPQPHEAFLLIEYGKKKPAWKPRPAAGCSEPAGLRNFGVLL
jgi:hypothetical protein